MPFPFLALTRPLEQLLLQSRCRSFSQPYNNNNKCFKPTYYFPNSSIKVTDHINLSLVPLTPDLYNWPVPASI